MKLLHARLALRRGTAIIADTPVRGNMGLTLDQTGMEVVFSNLRVTELASR